MELPVEEDLGRFRDGLILSWRIVWLKSYGRLRKMYCRIYCQRLIHSQLMVEVSKNGLYWSPRSVVDRCDAFLCICPCWRPRALM